MTWNQIIEKIRECALTDGQRKNLNSAVRAFRERRPGGGRCHHPCHYIPQFRALAKKFGIIDETTKISRLR